MGVTGVDTALLPRLGQHSPSFLRNTLRLPRTCRGSNFLRRTHNFRCCFPSRTHRHSTELSFRHSRGTFPEDRGSGTQCPCVRSRYNHTGIRAFHACTLAAIPPVILAGWYIHAYVTVSVIQRRQITDTVVIPSSASEDASESSSRTKANIFTRTMVSVYIAPSYRRQTDAAFTPS